MREKIKKFLRVDEFFLFTQKRIRDLMKVTSREVKRRATSRENRKFFVVLVKDVLGVVKLLNNGRFVKLLWAYVGLAKAGKALAIVRGRRIGDGSGNVLFDSLF